MESWGAHQKTCSDNSTDPIKTSLISLKSNSPTADCSILTKVAPTLIMDLWIGAWASPESEILAQLAVNNYRPAMATLVTFV